MRVGDFFGLVFPFRFVIEFGLHLILGILMLVHFNCNPLARVNTQNKTKGENQTEEITHPHLLMKFSRPK